MRIRREIIFFAVLVAASCSAAATSYQRFILVPLDQGGGYKLARSEAPYRNPKAGDVVVRMHAVSLNRRDIHVIDGEYDRTERREFVPLSDGAGEVYAVGDGVSRFRVGDRVVATFFRGWLSGRRYSARVTAVGAGTDGMLSEFVHVHENDLLRVPEVLTYEEASTLPCAALTAWNALFSFRDVERGDYVLVEGTGGISSFAILFAAAVGARPIVISSSNTKLEQVRARGAYGTIDYKSTPNWVRSVLAVTDGVGVHHVIEIRGQTSLPQSVAVLANGGQISLAGWMDGTDASIPMAALIARDASVNAFHVGSRADFEEMNEFIVRHRVHPMISRVFDFEDSQMAYDLMRSGNFVGKLVIRLP